MDYQKIYNAMISKALTRPELVGYYETHHVLPKCMGGTNDLSNLVKLTAREHFIAHWLLVKMHPKVWKLYYAMFQMTKSNATGHERIVTSRQFEIARRAISMGAKMRFELGLHPRITDVGRKVLSAKMIGDLNPMRLYPEKNHTARPHRVVFDDGTERVYQYGKLGYEDLGMSRSSWITAVRKGVPVPTFQVKEIIKE